MLDFDKIAEPRRVVVPVLNRSFVFEKKRYRAISEDGWRLVEIQNNQSRVLDNAIGADSFAYSESGESVRGYTNNNAFVFQNFDVAKRKWGFEIFAPLRFNQSPSFEAIKAIVWEDKQVYWSEPDYSDTKLFQFKDLLEKEQDLSGQKEVTPEIRTLFLFHALERANLKKLLEETTRKEEYDQLMSTIPGRLKVTLNRVDADLVGYSLSGNRLVVDWKIRGSGYQYNSVLDSQTLRVLEAGYCLSGHDKDHNLTSIVKLADDYEERNLVHITRSTSDDPDFD